MLSSGKRQLIWGGGSAAWISNELRSPDPGGGDIWLTASRAETFALPVDTYGHWNSCEEHVSFPLTQGLVEGPVLQPAGSRATQLSDSQHVEAVKVSAVLVDVTPELVDSPVPAGLAGNNGETNRMPPLVWQAALEDGLSMKEKVVAGVNSCDSVVGGPTSTFLSSVDGIVDLAGDITVSMSSSADLAGGVTVGVTYPADAGVASPAYLAGGVTIGVAPLAYAGVASPADFAEVASSADLAGDITVGVLSVAKLAGGVTVREASPAHAGVASPADLAGGVTVRVTFLADAEVVSPADFAEVASSADLAGNVVGLVYDYDDYYDNRLF